MPISSTTLWNMALLPEAAAWNLFLSQRIFSNLSQAQRERVSDRRDVWWRASLAGSVEGSCRVERFTEVQSILLGSRVLGLHTGLIAVEMGVAMSI